MVNAQLCSMAGIIDYGAAIGTKSSPRSLAIDKAQEELRQECDVREERRRELEFLEKGGNPLDFKFVHVATASVHSASLTNQIAEQNVISDAIGSFAASPHGDSVESSEKLGSSLCRETNTDDNIMLLGGDNNGEKTVKRGTKRLNTTEPKQLLPNDGHKNAKKTASSGLPRLGVKSQAYVRRNRSKPSRDNASVAPIRSSMTPAKGYEPKDEKGVVQKNSANNHVVFSVSSINQAGSICDNAPKNAASDGQVEMELDGFQTIRENECVVNSEVKQADNNIKAKEVSLNDANDNRPLVVCGDIAAEVVSIEIPYANSKFVTKSCAVNEKADDGHLDESMAYIHSGELDNRMVVPVCAVEASTSHKNAVGSPCEDAINIVEDRANGNTNLVAGKLDRKSHENLDSSRHSNMAPKGSGTSEGVSSPTPVKENSDLVEPSNILVAKDEMEVCGSAIVPQKDTGCLSCGSSMNIEGSPASDKKNRCAGDSNSSPPVAAGVDLHYAVHSLKIDESNEENETKKSGENLKMAKKAYEDSVLEKARVIEASVRKAGERSLCNISLEKRRKGHWDFVLEEMAWMANDFMQERLWKSVAAAQVCHWIASDGQTKFEEASIQRKQKTIMKILAKDIMSFWQTAHRTAKIMQEHDSTILEETKPSGIKSEKEQCHELLEVEESRQPRQLKIQDYAVRFIEFNSRTADPHVLPEAPPTPERLNDFGILKVSGHLSEESLFYTVAPGAMLAYRESAESSDHKKVGNAELKDDYEASVCDSAAVYSDLPLEDAYEEDEGETCTYISPEAYDGPKMGHKKKHLMQQRINIARPYEIGTNVPYEPCLERKSGNQPLLLNGKRPTSFLVIPPKRIRTSARQRVVSPFHSGPPQATSKTDMSSGDTNSYEDDQSSLHGGSLPWRNVDFESTVDSERKLPYGASEVCTKAHKKKKFKIPGYKTAQNAVNSCVPAAVKGRIHDPRLQVDLINKYEQKDYLKRSDIRQYDSNGNSVAYGGQHTSKKLKIMKQGIEFPQEASHVASQMSNMTNPAKFVKLIANRDRGRKCKALKMTSIGGWSSFEDQALVVLVHDMGQNWELISDAINSIVQFKSVHREPKECQERHKFLVDRSSGDGADSAEDSGSSQHYHNTLPGIPKGSARQLFERLQGPFEEEYLKSHFEKIILLMQQVHARRRQGNNQELKPIIQPHSSHVIALSQACSNKISGGILTPLDLCDAISPNLDPVTPGSVYPGSHTNGLTLPNHQGSVGPSTPTSNLNSRLPGSPGTVLGSNLLSPSTLNTPRDSQKYGVPRSASLQGDEQPKVQCNQIVSSRNLQQHGGSIPGALTAGVDRGSRLMPGAHGMGTVAGPNRGTPAARAGFPRISSPGVLNGVSGNLLANSGLSVPNAVSVHPGAISVRANSNLRPHVPMQTLRPDQGMEEHRQMPESHMRVSQGSSQAIQFSSMNPSSSNAAASSTAQQPQQPHQMSQSLHMFGNPQHSQIQSTSSSPQQQAYAVHLARERQMQQHMVAQRHSDLPGASAVPNLQCSSQILHQNQGSAANQVSCSQPQHQWQQAAQNLPDTSSSPNQLARITQQKQKKQQGQQQSRQNQPQRNQGSQQAKLMKSLGRGNMLMPQTTLVDSTPASTVSTPSKKNISDKTLMQNGQGLFPDCTAPTASMPQPGNQPKLFTSLPQSPKKLPDIGNQGLMPGSSSQTLLASQQSSHHSKSTLTKQLQQRQINLSQNSIETAMMQQSRQINSEFRTDSHIDQVQHNQMVPTSIPQSADSGSSVLSSVSQQKREAPHNLALVTSPSKLLSSLKDTCFGSETVLTSSSQDVRQVSGGFPTHVNGVGGQWNQQARQQLQSQHQQRPVVQSSAFASSNSGLG